MVTSILTDAAMRSWLFGGEQHAVSLGILNCYPSETSRTSIECLSFDAEIHWIEIEKDEEAFLGFMDEVLGVLESPEIPEPSPECKWCEYVREMRDFPRARGGDHAASDEKQLPLDLRGRS